MPHRRWWLTARDSGGTSREGVTAAGRGQYRRRRRYHGEPAGGWSNDNCCGRKPSLDGRQPDLGFRGLGNRVLVCRHVWRERLHRRYLGVEQWQRYNWRWRYNHQQRLKRHYRVERYKRQQRVERQQRYEQYIRCKWQQWNERHQRYKRHGGVKRHTWDRWGRYRWYRGYSPCNQAGRAVPPEHTRVSRQPRRHVRKHCGVPGDQRRRFADGEPDCLR